MTQATACEHLSIDESGVPVVEGTTMKVIEPVLEMHAHGWNPDELHFQHPYLTLGHIHSALAYYSEHKKDLDHTSERRLERVDQSRREIGTSP
jgi:uncharacterized protein (DUF433 family)